MAKFDIKNRKLSEKSYKFFSNITKENKNFEHWPERSLNQLNSFQEILNNKNSEFELIMECLLIKLGLNKFIKNYPIANRFWADFYFPKQRIIIEVDDISHKKRTWKDEARDKAIWSMNFGIRVFRFSTLAPYTDWEHDLINIFKNNKLNSLKSNPRRFYKSNANNRTKELEELEIKKYEFEYKQWRSRLDNARKFKIEFKLKPPIKPKCLKRIEQLNKIDRTLEEYWKIYFK